MTFRAQIFTLVISCAIAVATVSAQDKDFATLQRKAESGEPIAEYDLAKAYLEGKIVTKDAAQGLAWLQKSADQRYVGAEFALAYMYQNGAAKLPKDPHKAADWYRKAAKQQNKASQDALATMLAQGLISAEEANWRTAEPTVSQTPPQPLPHSPPNRARDVQGKPAPFSLAEVETGITGGITSKRMATLVQKFGVDFKLSSGARKRLVDEGADDNLLATISASKRSL